ncbi:Aldehyde dehydrogenase [Sphingobium herbicidovorans NBRC 16415]|uniref:Aldehyde dehydrogenase n=1 Tax=Sphingobium herbicidovorans (strain ATCC 700291 / DSM 11019 / CCUG 56400 / KCTC 2939 / LMG 18315 / NBRC 16415 / MH) TaxID=1219045 RepID=A0A086P7X0_SPHHM|nr:hypothetical protein [Sphingobium herbicidovorans]KFG89488.1 Aldehyde dehydrogenase [Sphingobium herbicidovorans NBRC 16415]
MIKVIAPSTEEVAYQVTEVKEADIVVTVEAARCSRSRTPAADVTCRARRLPPCHRHENCGEGRGYGRGGAYGDWNPGWVWARIGLVGCVVYEHHASLADSFPFVERHVPGPTGETVSGCFVQEPVGVVAAIIP